MRLTITIHAGGRYQTVEREKQPGEVLPFPHPGGVVNWTVPESPGEVTVTARDDEGRERIIATITIQ